MYLNNWIFLGDGDEFITPVYKPPTKPPWAVDEYDDEDDYQDSRKSRLCRGQNDEEDCIPSGSSGDGDEFISGSGSKQTLHCVGTCIVSVVQSKKIKWCSLNFVNIWMKHELFLCR